MVQLAEQTKPPVPQYGVLARLFWLPFILTPLRVVFPTLLTGTLLGAALGALSEVALGLAAFYWLLSAWLFSLSYRPSASASEINASLRHDEPRVSRVIAWIVFVAQAISGAFLLTSWRDRVVTAVQVGVTVSWVQITVWALWHGMPRLAFSNLLFSLLDGIFNMLRILVLCFALRIAASLLG